MPRRYAAGPAGRGAGVTVANHAQAERIWPPTAAAASSTFSQMATTADHVTGTAVRAPWVAAAVAGAAYGTFLIVTAAGLPAGAELTGRFALQPAAKALTAVLLAVAVLGHPIARERRWLVGALVFSAAGDVLLALPWWEPSFVLGLAAFLIAHLCFLTALVPLVRRRTSRVVACGVLVVVCAGLLVWMWPRLVADGMALPVTVYIAVLGAMACAALLADLPTPWTALGAVCFAVSDGMIGIGTFVLRSEVLAVPIWWAYAASILLITAGFLFGRGPAASVGAATPAT